MTLQEMWSLCNQNKLSLIKVDHLISEELFHLGFFSSVVVAGWL